MPEYENFHSFIRPWHKEAIQYVKAKYPQIVAQNSALALSLIIKYCRTRFILLHSSKVAFGVSKFLSAGMFASSTSLGAAAGGS